MADPAILPPEFDAAFQPFDLGVSDKDLHNSSINPYSNLNGLSQNQRTIAKNIYDGDTDGRRGYLKKLGYEMSKDGEGYRPVNFEGDFVPIDPDNTKWFVLPNYNPFNPEDRSEFWKDVKDVGAELLVVGPLLNTVVAPAVRAGMAAGGSLGVTLGAPLGPMGRAALGGAGALVGGAGAGIATAAGISLLTDTTKKALAKIFLEDDVPLDMHEALYNAAITGVTTSVLEGGVSAVKNLKKAKVEDTLEGIKTEIVKRSGGDIPEKLAADVVQNPHKYTPGAVEGANDKVLNLQVQLFGTSVENPKTTRQLKGGILKEKINDLNEQANLELNRLSRMPEANFSVEEIEGLIRKKAEPLLRPGEFKSDSEKKVIEFLNRKLKEVRDAARVESPKPSSLIDPTTGKAFVSEVGEEKFRELPFKEGRKILKDIQDHAFEGDVKGEAQALLRGVAGEFRRFADDKASSVKSPLPEINLKRSRVLSLYNGLRQVSTDSTLRDAYVGGSRLAKTRFDNALRSIDDEFDTRLAEGAETTQFQAAMERFFDNPKNFGTDHQIIDALKGGLKEGTKGAFQGGMVGQVLQAIPGVPKKAVNVLAAVGGVKGIARGGKKSAQFSSPDILMKEVSRIKTRVDDLAKNPTLLQKIRQAYLGPSGQIGAEVDAIFPAPPDIIGRNSVLAPEPEPSPQPDQTQTQTPKAASLPPEFEEAFKDFKPPEGL